MIIDPVASASAQSSALQIFHHFQKNGIPFVIRAGASHWDCTSRWTQTFLNEKYGDAIVDFQHCASNARKAGKLKDYFTLPPAEQAQWYVCDWDFRKQCPELLTDISPLPQFPIDWINQIPAKHRPDLLWIYIGHAATFGPAHVDSFGSSGWLAILQGTKRVRFTTRGSATAAELAQLRLFDGSIAKSAHHFGLTIQEVTLQGGDLLFVPAGCWHAAYNDTYCISLTANFIDGSNFGQFAANEKKNNFSKRILISQLNSLQSMSEGLEKQQLAAHLSCALQDYETLLQDELAQARQFTQFLLDCHVAAPDALSETGTKLP